MLAVIIPDRETPDVDIVPRIISAGERGGAGEAELHHRGAGFRHPWPLPVDPAGSGGSAGNREISQDGHELRFAVNYLAGFLLTRVLLPVVMLGKPARIVNVSSLGMFG